MKEHIKYLERRERKTGVIWVVNPTRAVRNALDVGYEQFTLREEAEQRAREISIAFEDYKRGIKRDLRINEETIDGLFAFFTQTKHFRDLKPNSKRSYTFLYRTAQNMRIGQANVNFGQMLIKSVDAGVADALYQAILDRYSKHRANNCCKVLRRMFYTARRTKFLRRPDNPFAAMGMKETPARKTLWEPEQVQAFIDQCDANHIPELGTLALLCYDLCQRPGDMRQLRWSQFRDGVIHVTQEKTGAEVSIPASPRLLKRLEDEQKRIQHAKKFVEDNPTNKVALRMKRVLPGIEEFVCCYWETGKIFDRFLYHKHMQRMRDLAGLPKELQFRDLRRTGATEMAEAGCTEDELLSVTGHKTRGILNTYIRHNQRMAASGVNKRFS